MRKELRSEIEKIREKIDEIDRAIVNLLNHRAQYALNLGEIKKILDLEIYMPEREKEVLKNVVDNNPGPLSAEALRRLYERIIDESRRLEREHSENPDKRT